MPLIFKRKYPKLDYKKIPQSILLKQPVLRGFLGCEPAFHHTVSARSEPLRQASVQAGRPGLGGAGGWSGEAGDQPWRSLPAEARSWAALEAAQAPGQSVWPQGPNSFIQPHPQGSEFTYQDQCHEGKTWGGNKPLLESTPQRLPPVQF